MTAAVAARRLRSRPGAGAGGWVVITGRAGAVLTLAAAGGHLLAVGTGSPVSWAMAGMALACLPCARHLWRSPTVPVWATTALVDSAMIAVHAPLTPAAGGHVHGGGSGGVVLLWPATAPAVGSLLLALGVLAAAAWTSSRRTAPAPEEGAPGP